MKDLKHIKTPIRFNTEEECNNFLNSIGLKRV
jgi:hypothetical protein